MSASKTVGRLRAILGLDKTGFSTGLSGAKNDLKSFQVTALNVGRSLKTALGLTVAGLGIQQLVSSARQAVSSIASIGDEAKRAGMSAKAFQEWKFVAEQSRIGIDAMIDGFKELNLRADEFVETGGGSAAEAFKRLGYTSEDLKKKLKDPSALMLELFGRMRNLDAAARIRISDEIFGGSAGERFVELLDKGEQVLLNMIQRAHEVGAVMSGEMIAKADELQRKFEEISEMSQNALKKGAVTAFAFLDEQFTFTNSAKLAEFMGTVEYAKQVLGEEMFAALSDGSFAIEEHLSKLSQLGEYYSVVYYKAQDLADAYIDAADAAFELGNVDAANALISAATAADDLVRAFQEGRIGADELVSGLQKIRSDADRAISSLSGVDAASMSGVIGEIDQLSGAMETAITMAQSLMAWLRGITGFGATDIQTAVDERRQAIEEHASGLAFNDPMISSPRPPEAPPMTHELGDPGKGGGGGGKGKRGGGGKSRDGYARSVESIREETAALEAEAVALLAVASAGGEYGDAVEYARKKAELLHEAQKEGKQITPELEAQIDQLAMAYAEAASSAEDAREKLERIKEEGKAGVEAISDIFSSLLDGSKSAKEALADLLMQMAKVQLQKAILGLVGGGGGAFSFIGGLLNVGANANGTNNWRGGLTTVNERGDEIMNLPRGTQIIPHEISKRMADQAARNHRGGNNSEIIVRPEPGVMVEVARGVVRQESKGIIGRSVQASARSSRRSKSIFGVR